MAASQSTITVKNCSFNAKEREPLHLVGSCFGFGGCGDFLVVHSAFSAVESQIMGETESKAKFGRGNFLGETRKSIGCDFPTRNAEKISRDGQAIKSGLAYFHKIPLGLRASCSQV